VTTGGFDMEDEINWFAGVDWASQTHHVRLSDTKGAKIGERTFAHGSEGLKEMADSPARRPRP
jgi:hypothetical protein